MDEKVQKVINKIRTENVTLWAGAGLSLYAGYPTGKELAAEIVKHMPKRYQEDFKGRALPEVAEEFVQMSNGLRPDLFQILKKYLIKEPISTEYHEKLAEIPQIKQIVTTNYDDLFERVYKKSKLSVILENSQLTLANTPVKLYKIHGDMTHPESMVLTDSDYNTFFSFANKNKSLWNKVASLADESSFLFLGYSLEDPNVQKLLTELIDEVGDFRHESFLVVPNLPEYKIQNLQRRNITYINMTGQDFINQLHSEIIAKIVIDYEAGLLNPSEVDEALIKRGIIDAKYEYRKGKATLVEFRTSDENEPLSLNMNVKKNEDDDQLLKLLMNDVDNQEIEINPEATENVVPEYREYKGIQFPSFTSLDEEEVKESKIENEKFTETPDRLLTGSFIIDESNEIIENIEAHVLVKEKYIKIKFVYENFIIQSTLKEINGAKTQTYKISFNFNDNLIKSYRASEFLRNWFVNGQTIIFVNDTDKTLVPLESPKRYIKENEDEELSRLVKEITFFADLFKDVLSVQQYFETYLTIPKKFTKKDKEVLDEALIVVNQKERKAKNLTLTLNATNHGNQIRELLENRYISFKSVTDQPAEISLFNQKILLGHSFIETSDGYVTNRDEVLALLNEGSEKINLIIESKSDEMYFGYQDKKEIEEQ